MNPQKLNEEVLAKITDAVSNLYNFRDHYFDNHPVNEATAKITDISKELEKTLQLLDEHKEECEKLDRAKYLMLKGRALNITSDYSPEAFEVLSRAVKFNPKLVEAWNELGECLWKKGDVQGARNCFERALKQCLNKTSLRNISMVLRQISQEPKEKIRNIHESVEKAKEAVQMDLEDGLSWYILGNAYLNLFFVADQSPKILKQSMSAYIRAMSDPAARSNPDLHYNRAVGLKYDEAYKEALESFEKAASLDPLWPEPVKTIEKIEKFLQQTQQMVYNKGNQKARKLQNFLKSLKLHHLGPYGKDSSSSSTGRRHNTFQHIKLCQLLPGVNQGKVVLGKVVGNIVTEDEVPFSFCLVDEDEACVSVTVYNIAEGKGVIIGDSVAIPDPDVHSVDFKYKDKHYQFTNIRVNTPLRLVVNGRVLSHDKHAAVRLDVTLTSQ
ncbi:tetratricopeptide repeat protein 5-like [Limulus polyphemus]|uniref:Tetratricopeptide repeat protein 5-like n=1 Tax=Limulus polyphemus TaxID=6850 RepID=A0ABM1S106_LIMPO|nr:tetratricopeptide repeat protein 5-like [Limulus polyphemus]XP_013794045.1 tetratricopeptide repeat protein 5-like [Limulus polyphemus]XP_022237310.1 tetratricopeptide repeat protein 5-like [Limulus polyphemus]XP_022237311.1 tetratricopeptide repeat protein 5-like [Limulus polyphemus]XP_022237313.1 tetratricopeptide repeat protein 5-like [Limulus polyphemus]XP_022237314.1 tetratricopeptide repeat protein 5-like [Limulus polyphemus]XP_022237315.1 tetratricopeptide repeat protein 5-like [Lim